MYCRTILTNLMMEITQQFCISYIFSRTLYCPEKHVCSCQIDADREKKESHQRLVLPCKRNGSMPLVIRASILIFRNHFAAVLLVTTPAILKQFGTFPFSSLWKATQSQHLPWRGHWVFGHEHGCELEQGLFSSIRTPPEYFFKYILALRKIAGK